MREAIGVSLIVLVLVGIRKILFGKISRKMQYTLWLSIPIYLLLCGFVRIPVAVNHLLPAAAKQPAEIFSEEMSSGSAVTESSNSPGEIIISSNQVSKEPSASSPDRTLFQNSKVYEQISIFCREAGKAIPIIGWGAASVLLAYNLLFLCHCHRHRRFLKKDPETGMNIYVLRRSGSPFLLGRSIYVPSQIITDDKLLTFAIMHEYCHFRQGDFIWPIVRYLVLALNWYNPFVWYAFRLAGQDSELACDEAVIGILGETERRPYGEALIHMMKNRNACRDSICATTRMVGNKHLIKERICCISKGSAHSAKRFVAGALCMVMVTGCALVKPEASAAEMKKGSSDISETSGSDVSTRAVSTLAGSAKPAAEEADRQKNAETYASYDYDPGDNPTGTLFFKGRVYYSDIDGIQCADLNTGEVQTLVSGDGCACVLINNGWLYYQSNMWDEKVNAEICRLDLNTGTMQKLLEESQEMQTASVFAEGDYLYLSDGVKGSLPENREYVAYHIDSDGTVKQEEDSPVSGLLAALNRNTQDTNKFWNGWLCSLIRYHKVVQMAGKLGNATLTILDADGAEPLEIPDISGNIYTTFKGLVYQDMQHNIHLLPWNQPIESDQILLDYTKENRNMNYGPSDSTGIYGFFRTADKTVITKLYWDGTVQELEDVSSLGEDGRQFNIRLSGGDDHYCYYDRMNNKEIIRKIP
ncbi:MAG: hypothetical protein LKJ76_07290 [Lachnospiraceae bacterium]|jgi:beta-lactamase regulating signal transducer with metallopeptidase domain|nr:hypothetical protein [Lachnospiraceae bacterium]